MPLLTHLNSSVTPMQRRRSRSDPSIFFCNISMASDAESLPRPSVKKGGRSSSRTKKSKPPCNSDLTEESLKEFNKRTAGNGKKNNTSLRKGRTDSSANPQTHGAVSPGRESTVTSSSITSVFIRIQQWGSSCFNGKNDREENRVKMKNSATPCVVKEVDVNSMSSVVETKSVVLEEKPLRERVSETGAQPVLVATRVIGVEEKVKEVVVNNGKETEFRWADKYRPKALKDFICNRDKAEELQLLMQNGECSHYIFEGHTGVGRRTMVWALLREAFGPENLVTREECMVFSLKGEDVPSITVKVQVSSQHTEINLSELRGYEKSVIVELMKERHNMGLHEDMQCDHTNCHAIILHEADMLSTDAQLYIRWLMEKTKACKKVFFCCRDASKLQPIKSLCKVIQLLPPSKEEIVEVLEFIAAQEDIKLPHQLAERMAENSKQNLQQAIRSFEASWRLNYPFKEDQVIMTGWEEDIANIAKNIIEEQSPKQLYFIRGKLQSLIEHNVSPEFIFSTLAEELKRLVDDALKSKIDALYEEYIRACGNISNSDSSSNLSQGTDEESREIRKHEMKKNVQRFMKIEEFIAKFMSLYKSSMSQSNGN